MDEAAQDVVPSHASRSAGRSGRIRRRVRRPEVEPTVRAPRVVVNHVLAKHPLEVTATKDERPVEALAPDGSHPTLGEGVRLRGPERGEHHADAVGREDGVEAPGYLESRSRIRSRNGPRSDRSKERFRACWVTHAVSGRLVAPATWTHLVWTSMTKNTYSVRSHAVSTVKKSAARTPLAWPRRNSLHVGPDRRGAGPRPWRRRSVRMAVAETLTPSLASSPLIRRHPHRGFSRPILRMRSRTSGAIGGRPPVDPWRYVHFLRTSSRCQRRSVCGRMRNEDHRSRGSALLSAARYSRSRRRRRGRPTWRLRTAS